MKVSDETFQTLRNAAKDLNNLHSLIGDDPEIAKCVSVKEAKVYDAAKNFVEE